MYVTVHRGTRQIGGNLIEIGTDRTRHIGPLGNQQVQLLFRSQQLPNSGNCFFRGPKIPGIQHV